MLISSIALGLLATLGSLVQEEDSPAQKKALQELKVQQALLQRQLDLKEARIKKLQAELEKLKSPKWVAPPEAPPRAVLERLRDDLKSQGQDGEDKRAILRLVEDRLRAQEERMKAEHATLLLDLSRLLDKRLSKGTPGEAERQSLDEMERRLLDDLNALRKLKEPRAAAAKPGVLGIAPAIVDGGVQIQSLVADGPAQKAGLREGDVIVAIGGKPVRTLTDLTDQLRILGPGGKADLQYTRDGATLRVTVILGVKRDE